MRKTGVIAGVLAFGLILASGCDLGPDTEVREAGVFGRSHSAVGPASLLENLSTLDVRLSETRTLGGVRVEMANNERLNVYLEPVHIPVGAYFEASVIGEIAGERHVLGKIMHNQIGERQTELAVDFRPLQQYADDSRLTVSTYIDGRKTYESKVSTDSTDTIGTVDSGGDEWAESYHWMCVNGSCSLLIDPAPAETITFAHDPTNRQPFNYLVFQVEGVENVTSASAMQLVGSGIQGFRIIGEDDKLLFEP